MKLTCNLYRLIASLGLSLACLMPFAAQANSGGEGGGGPAPLTFTVNVGKKMPIQYLQVQMAFEFADPEVQVQFQGILPRIKHKIILILGDEDVATLLTIEGKKKLQEHLRDAINELLETTPKNGLHDVLFTNFIIQ